MKKGLAAAGLAVMLAGSAGAWQPSGWVYHDYPWAYEPASGDWYWFHTGSTQWVARMSTGAWARLPDSALASGWAYYNWAFAFCQNNGAWHWVNESDVQPVVNMRTGGWSDFGEPTVPADLVLIPAGTNSGTDPDFGAYSWTLGSYYMGRHEVTQALWDEVHAWGITNGYLFGNAGSGKGTNHPVHSVNWYDCVKWCNARSEKEGRRPIYYYTDGGPQVYRSGRRDLVSISIMPGDPGYALPTAAQWEYAARGGVSGRRFPWADSDGIQHARANYYSFTEYDYDTSPTRGVHPSYEVGEQPFTSPVGSFAANGYGLHDMAGNVFEWCWNWHPDYENTRRTIRGGSYGYLANAARVGMAVSALPEWTEMVTGFRVVLMPGP
jgi:formylglycine-generating enzyme required for sulfatase activity